MGGEKFQMILRLLQTWAVLMLAFIASGCMRKETPTDKVFFRPDCEPIMQIGRCAVVPEFGDQILIEVFLVNNGRTPVALDLNRFSLDLMDMSPQGYLWPLWGWYDSLDASCVIVFSPNSTNRFVLLTSYIGVDTPSREHKESEERRWREREAGGEYDIRLYYRPPTEATYDYLWTTKKSKHERQTSVLVGVVNMPLPAKQGNASPSWDEWRTSRTNDPFRVLEK